MANFLAYPGLFVRIKEDMKGLEVDKVYQVMYVGKGTLAFVGVNGLYSIRDLKMEPVYAE